jgi:hypothetical protein
MWLHGEGCQLDASTCSAAAGGGHLEVLMWLHGEGCQLDADTCMRIHACE